MIKKTLLLPFLLFVGFAAQASGAPHRFSLEGDGIVKLQSVRSGAGGTFSYRDGEAFDLKAIDQIAAVFGLKDPGDEYIHPRLIALLDYLQDELKGGTIRILSGYRSPSYNEGLRKKGRLAARTSLHIEGMAADIEMDGVTGLKLWEFVRSLNCCGAGYYHGKGIHVDVGPSRFWDEKSTGVEKDLGGHNKLILVTTNFDRYRPGEIVYLTLGRVTDYPFGVRPEAALVTPEGKEVKKAPIVEEKMSCVVIKDREAARSLAWMIPKDLALKDRIHVRIDFCEKPFGEMPDSILSSPILITSQ